jgi:hypothetical protein
MMGYSFETRSEVKRRERSISPPSTSSANSFRLGLSLASTVLQLSLANPTALQQEMVSSVSKPDSDKDAAVITPRPRTDENIFLFVPNLVGMFKLLTLLYSSSSSPSPTPARRATGDQLGL